MAITASKPSVESAWAFFRLKTLPRRVRDEAEEKEAAAAGKPQVIYRLASSREASKAQVYPVCATSARDLGQFGIGIALYFKQLQWLALAFCVYGALNLWTINHYATTYDASTPSWDYTLAGVLPGSAECLDETSVALTNCGDGTPCEGVYRASCNLKFIQGVLDLCGMGFLVIYCIAVAFVQERAVEELDEATQTTQDYGVVVNDPGPNDDNPDEWRDFFSQFGTVAYVTIVRANGDLVKALSARRLLKYSMQLLIPTSGSASSIDAADPTAVNTAFSSSPLHRKAQEMEGAPLLCSTATSYNGSPKAAAAPPSCLKKVKQALGMGKDLAFYEAKLIKADIEIARLSKIDYPVTKVFAVFNEEDGQRQCLKALSTGLVQSTLELGHHLPESHKFHGTNVLHVEEPVEASEVLWWNLELSLTYRMSQSFVSFLLTVALVIATYFVIYYIKTSASSSSLALVVSVLNSLLPMICRQITAVERHVDHGDEQDSLLFKLVCARFMNTAIINYMTTDFADTLTYTELKAVQALLWSDAIYTPTIALLNVTTNFKQRILAPRAATQRAMNSYFLGQPWSLAERYTSMSKTVFVALFYGAIFPAGYFFAALCFSYTFIVDRYMLLRAWKKPPAYGAELASKASQLVAVAALTHLVITANWFAGWPFDDVIYDSEGIASYINKQQRDGDTAGQWFRVVPQSWMSAHQKALTGVYGWTSFIAILVALIYWIGLDAFNSLIHLFKGSYKAVGDSQGHKFNTMRNIQTYVPLAPPANDSVGVLLACHTIDAHPIHFPDLGPYIEEHDQKVLDSQNVAKEFPEEARSRLFGTVKGYLTLELAPEADHHHTHFYHRMGLN